MYSEGIQGRGYRYGDNDRFMASMDFVVTMM